MLSLNKLKLLFLAFSFLLLSLFLPLRVTAASTQIFYDNFSEIDEQKWLLHYNQGGISISDGSYLHLESGSSQTSPYVYGETHTGTESAYDITTRFKMEGPLNYGAGISFTDKLLQNQTTADLTPDDVVFFIWPESPSTYSFWTTLCPKYEASCSGSAYRKISSFSSGQYNNLHIKRTEDFYEVHLNEEVPKFFALDRDIEYIWIGNPQKTNTSTQRPTIFVDYIEITKEPVDVQQNTPTIILPGFGGSWDLSAIITGQPGNNWQIPGFIKEYQGITNSLINAGYEQGEDLFTFAYDWRKPLDELADDLDQFISDNNLEDKKLNLVGHSMGGLVARAYLQKHNNENIEKVVTAGSPHKGIVDAYGMWEGLTVWDAVWWQKVLVAIASEVSRQPGETRLESVRRFSPSIKDLLPTESYLVKDGIPVSISSMFWKNDYLNIFNNLISGYTDKIIAGASGDKGNTREKINVTAPSKSDILRGMWVDGKPISPDTFTYTQGDGYITQHSSLSLFPNTLNLQGWHGETISDKDNIIKILTELNIATESAVGSDFDNREKVLVFKLNSPGILSVCLSDVCNEDLGLVFPSEKIILVPGFSEGVYKTKIAAGGQTGNYEILVGEVAEESIWQSLQGQLQSTNQEDNYVYATNTNQLSATTQTVFRNLNLFWPTGLDPKKINETRQKILKDIDLNISQNNIQEFDTNIDKWRILDSYINSQNGQFKGFSHSGWEKSFKAAVKSKYLGSTPTYFTEQLTELYLNTQDSYNQTTSKNIFIKTDKLIQVNMLKIFIGL